MRIIDRVTSSPGILGKVKVGEKVSKGGKEYPTSLDYFRFTGPSYRIKRMNELLGSKPDRIPVTFHSDDANQVCIQRYECRNGSGQLVAYGDGNVFFKSTPKGYEEVHSANFMQECRGDWKEILILRFMIMGYQEYGVWEFRSGGKETSIKQIIDSFDTVKEHAGRVKGMPFWLTVAKQKSNRPDVNRIYPVVNLVCDLSPEMIERVAGGVRIQGYLVTKDKLMLPEAVSSEIEEAEVISHEEIEELTPTSSKWAEAVRFVVEGGTVAKILKKYSLSSADEKYLDSLIWFRDQYQAGERKFDPYTSVDMGIYLFETRGSNPWNESKGCWYWKYQLSQSRPPVKSVGVKKV